MIEAPESATVKLGEVVKKAQGAYDPHIDPEMKYIGADHIEEGGQPIERWGMTSDSNFPPTFRHTFVEGDVLIHSRNPRKVAVAPHAAVTGEKLFVLRSRDRRLLDQYLYYVLLTSRFQKFADGRSFGSTNRFLNWGALIDFEFQLPEVDRQREILGILEHAEKALSMQRTSEYALTQLLRAELDRSFGRTASNADQIPICDLGTVITGTTPPTQHREYFGGRIPFVNPGDLGSNKYVVESEKRLTQDGARVARTIPRGSVMVTCIGFSIGKVGISGVEELATNQQINSIISNDPQDSEALYYAVVAARDRIIGAAAITATPILPKRLFEQTRLLWPPEPERRKAALTLGVIDATRDAMTHHATRLQDLRKGLIDELIGSLR